MSDFEMITDLIADGGSLDSAVDVGDVTWSYDIDTPRVKTAWILMAA